MMVVRKSRASPSKIINALLYRRINCWGLFTSFSRAAVFGTAKIDEKLPRPIHVELHNVCRSMVGDDRITTRRLNWPEGTREYIRYATVHVHIHTLSHLREKHYTRLMTSFAPRTNHFKRTNKRFRNQLRCIIFVGQKSESRRYCDSNDVELLEEMQMVCFRRIHNRM